MLTLWYPLSGRVYFSALVALMQVSSQSRFTTLPFRSKYMRAVRKKEKAISSHFHLRKLTEEWKRKDFLFMKQPEPSVSPISAFLEEGEKKEWWWHRLTLAPEVRTAATTAAQREANRYARLVSTIAFALIVIICLLIPATFFIPNHY